VAPVGARAAVGAAGVAAFVAGSLIAPDRGYLSVAQWPLIVGGLAGLCFVALSAPAGRLAAPPARALAWFGVASYAALIISEPLRSVTHTLRAEGAGAGWLALWVIAGFVPLVLLLARPLAMVLGLIERGGPALRIAELIGRPVTAGAGEATVDAG
jgi:peptidoglycan/LPS O-acetylase OafA/YrhL